MDLAAEFRDCRDPTVAASLGVSNLAAARAGGIGITNIETDGLYWGPHPEGKPAIILPVCTGVHGWGDLVDLVAFDTSDPSRWRVRSGNARALGEWFIHCCRDATPLWSLPGDDVMHLPVFRTPLNWLRHECKGAVILHESWASGLLSGLSVTAEDRRHGLALKAQCELSAVPRIFVPTKVAA